MIHIATSSIQFNRKISCNSVTWYQISSVWYILHADCWKSQLLDDATRVISIIKKTSVDNNRPINMTLENYTDSEWLYMYHITNMWKDSYPGFGIKISNTSERS